MLKNKIYVIGSINIDEKISIDAIPKAGETKHGKDYHISFGGKGANQAIVAASLGANTTFLGRVGKEIQGEEAISELKKYRVNVDSVILDDEPTGRAIIIYENNDNRIMLVGGANEKVSVIDVDNFLDGTQGDILLIQFELPLDTLWHAIEVAKKKNMTVVVNPAPAKEIPDKILNKIDYLVLNQSESELLTKIYPESQKECKSVVSKLRKYGVKNIIITLGKEGAYYAVDNLEGLVPTIDVEVVDTTGAGDTFIGMLVFGLWKDVIKYSVVAGALACTKENAHDYVPTLREIEEEL